MNDSLNNKELVAAGHEFAKALSSDTAIIDIVKMVSRLAERLDCTSAALRETKTQRDALAVENAALKAWAQDRAIIDDALEQENYTSLKIDYRQRSLRNIETPATDAYLAEVRAQGVEGFLKFCGEENSVFVEAQAYYRSLADAVDEFAAQLR